MAAIFASPEGNAMVIGAPKEHLASYIKGQLITPATTSQQVGKMGQVIPKFGKGGEGDKKRVQTPVEPKGLDEFLKKNYETYFKQDAIKDFDAFYHQFYLVIQHLNMEGGAMQLKLPDKATLEEKFKKYHPKPDQPLSKKEFKNIMEELIQLDSMHVGKGALDVLMFLFGVPIVALLAKRFIPGAQSIPEDIVIPAATSITVVALTKTHRL